MWILCGLVALFFLFCFLGIMPSVLWHCWLGSRKNIQPVKIEWWGAGVVICLELGAVLHIAQLMPLPLSVSCFCNIQIGFTFQSAPLGSPGQRAIKWVYVLRHYDLLTWLLHTLRVAYIDRFYRSMLCIRGTSHGPVSVSVTSRCSTKTTKCRITQTTPHDTPGTLVFWCQRSPRNSTGVTPYEGAECRWGGQNQRLSTNNRLYLENGRR